jgi:lipid-A-disaccharide synthase
MIRLFLIAGEPSGDRLGAALLEGLHALGAAFAVEGIGGPGMAAAGLRSRFPMDELSVMGVAEVLPRLPRLLARIRETAAAVAATRPDALVTIDSPDFSLRVASRARKALPGLRTIHYVAPTVWAWRPGRAARMARSVDHVLALYPFEPPYMQAAGMTCDFVGHPVAATPIATEAEISALRGILGLGDRPWLALLFGSRASEVSRVGPVLAEVLARLRRSHPELAVLVAAAGSVADAVRALLPADPSVILLDPRSLPDAEAEMWKRAAFRGARAALAVSGTVGLELAAQSTPTVIAYDASALTAAIAKRLVRVDTASMVNIVTGTRAIPEFLFENCRPDVIAPAVARLLDDPAAADAQRAVAAEAMRRLGRGDEPPGLRAARSVLAALAARTAGAIAPPQR